VKPYGFTVFCLTAKLWSIFERRLRRTSYL
jgi:hypothetical protein